MSDLFTVNIAVPVGKHMKIPGPDGTTQDDFVVGITPMAWLPTEVSAEIASVMAGGSRNLEKFDKEQIIGTAYALRDIVQSWNLLNPSTGESVPLPKDMSDQDLRRFPFGLTEKIMEAAMEDDGKLPEVSGAPSSTE